MAAAGVGDSERQQAALSTISLLQTSTDLLKLFDFRRQKAFLSDFQLEFCWIWVLTEGQRLR